MALLLWPLRLQRVRRGRGEWSFRRRSHCSQLRLWFPGGLRFLRCSSVSFFIGGFVSRTGEAAFQFASAKPKTGHHRNHLVVRQIFGTRFLDLSLILVGIASPPGHKFCQFNFHVRFCNSGESFKHQLFVRGLPQSRLRCPSTGRRWFR